MRPPRVGKLCGFVPGLVAFIEREPSVGVPTVAT